MTRFVYSTIACLAAKAVGLLLAILLLPGFTIGFLAYLVAVLIFSAKQVAAGPLLLKLSTRYVPQIIGGIALVAVFFGLLVTETVMDGMQTGGISNWLAATLPVWIGSLVASLVVPLILARVISGDMGRRVASQTRATLRLGARRESCLRRGYFWPEEGARGRFGSRGVCGTDLALSARIPGRDVFGLGRRTSPELSR